MAKAKGASGAKMGGRKGSVRKSDVKGSTKAKYTGGSVKTVHSPKTKTGY